MSSGQWEVVGKNKKSQNGKVKTKDDEKKPVKNGHKSDDFVQWGTEKSKSYYAGMETDEDKKAKKKEAEKKNRLKQKKNDAKPKPPTTIEGALQAIDPTELASIITSNKMRFSNAPLVWLKEIATFLNSKTQIDVEDPTFPHQPSLYPLSAVPIDIRTILERVLADAGKANNQLFFDVTLTAVANDLSRGQHVNGHRILVQMLAQQYPEFCTASVQKSASLRNSYQNRPPVGLTLLWALGQGGSTDFAVGMKAWQDLFLPVIELKSYSKYVVGYLSKLLARHGNMDTARVSNDQLLTMFDTVNNKRTALPKDLANELVQQMSIYKDIFFNRCGNKLQVTFNQILKKLPNQYLSGASLDPYHQVLVESLVDCLERDDSCNATWRQLFNKCTKQSATLLDYINSNWSKVSPKLKQKSLKATVIQYKEVGVEALKGKKKDETVVITNKICQDILDRMTSTRKFPWLWASFFLLVSIAGLVSYDVHLAGGNFPKSATGRVFKDLGILEHSQKAWQKTLSTSARGYLWVETNAPVYYTKTVEIVTPYAQLSKDLFIITAKKAGVFYENMRDYIVEKTPVVVATIEQYAPGLLENVKSYSTAAYNTVVKYSSDYYQLSADYLKTKVFVGEWAPEILQNKTVSALNVTRFHVSSYFHWFREQVHLYSEIP